MFSGFSDDDINKIKTGQPLEGKKWLETIENANKNANILRSQLKIKKPFKSTKEKSLSNSSSATSKNTVDIPDGAKLTPTTDLKVDDNVLESIDLKPRDELNDSIPVITSKCSLNDLEKFQLAHKQMKCENDRRKELLAKALEDKTKKTAAEIQRLENIQAELRKLDSLVSNDISIIRVEIERESLEYSQIQKRFEVIEAEYTKLRTLLKMKNDRKELLTKHLCTIIQQNEQRKADKLAALMNDLSLDANANL